jgi:hypothetical protein
MSMSRASRLLRKALAGTVAAALILLAPGYASYAAAAVVVGSFGSAAPGAAVGAAGAGAAASLPVSPIQALPMGAGLAPLNAAPSLSAFPVSVLPGAVAPAAVPTAGVLPVLPAAAAPLAAPSAPAGARAFSAAAAPVAAAASRAAAVPAPSAFGAASETPDAPSLRARLSRTAASLGETRDGTRKQSLLDRLFTGARTYFGLDEAAPARTPAAAPAAAPAPSAAAAAAAAAPSPISRSKSLAVLTAPSAHETGETPETAGRATPPSPVKLEGRGLQPGEKFLSEAKAASVPAAEPQAPKGDDWIDTKGVVGMFLQRSISIALFIQTALAYPLIAIGAVGTGTFGVLMALGPLAAIATGPLNGLIADKMSPRNGLIMLSLLRAAQTIALPALAYFGMLNFWTLLMMSVANGWQLSLLMTSENAYFRRLAGKNQLSNIYSLGAVNYLGLQVFLTLILGVGSLIDKFGPMMPFIASSVILPLVVVPLIWFLVPNTKGAGAAAAATQAVSSVKERLRGMADKGKAFLKKYRREIGLFAGAVGVYLAFHTTLPMSAALFWWVSRSDGFKAVWAQKNLRATMLLTALAFGLIYPFQYMMLPLMAGVLGGTAGKGLILGQLLGALFFGQLAANASQAKLPRVKIPFTGKTVPAERIVQGAVLAMAAAWTFLRLFPGSWPAAAGAAALSALLMYASSKLTSRGWIKHVGLGLAAASLIPLFFFGSLPAIFAGMMMLGLFAGPTQVALNTYFGSHAREASVGNAFGVSSSLNNSATSLGYGLMTLLVGLFAPVFPGVMGPLAVAFLGVGAVFYLFGPRLLPGLPEKDFDWGGKKPDQPEKK